MNGGPGATGPRTSRRALRGRDRVSGRGCEEVPRLSARLVTMGSLRTCYSEPLSPLPNYAIKA